MNQGTSTPALIETTLKLWASSLQDVKGPFRPLFTQGERPR